MNLTWSSKESETKLASAGPPKVTAQAARGLEAPERQELLRLLRHMQDNLRDSGL